MEIVGKTGTVTETVYAYQVFDFQSKTMEVATYKASRQTIVQVFGGEVLEGTAEDVPSAELDAQGRWHRIATGWGELA